MRIATNQIGFHVEVLTTNYGWCVAGFNPPHLTREAAQRAMADLVLIAPAGTEYRIYTALEEVEQPDPVDKINPAVNATLIALHHARTSVLLAGLLIMKLRAGAK